VSLGYDVFCSNAHANKEHAGAIVDAFREAGLRMWFNGTEIEAIERITGRSKKGSQVGSSLFPSIPKTYSERRACQQSRGSTTPAALASVHPKIARITRMRNPNRTCVGRTLD
jgi:hypothetical protein